MAILKTFKFLGFAVIGVILLPLLILLIPIAVVAGVIDIPAGKRRQEKLNESVENLWLPNYKYVYIQYASSSPLNDFIKTKVVHAYQKHLVADCWEDKASEWRGASWDKIDKQLSRLLISELSPDCEGLAIFSAIGIDPVTKKFDRTSELVVYGPPNDDTYTVDSVEYGEDDVKKLIINHIEQLIAKHDTIPVRTD